MMFDFLTDYTFLLVTGGTMLLAVASGIVGSIMVLQKESLVGDALSHAALPGVVVAFLIAQEKVTAFLLIGACLSAFIAILIIYLIRKYTELAFDGILAIVLSSFFGLGMVLLTFAQKLPNAAQAGLRNFIFGQAAAVLTEDAIFILFLAFAVIIIITIFWKEIKVYVFDPVFAKTQGVNPTFMQLLISTLMIVVVITQIQTIGVVLTSAMLIAPGVAALQWSRTFHKTVILASLFGAVSAIIGTIISTLVSNMPTGPIIVVCVSLIAVLSVCFAPKGVLMQKVRHNRMKKMIQKGEQ